MGDCPNVEMRELLPDRVAELLSGAEAARVDAHVVSCELCTYEVTVLRAARLTLQRGLQVDVQRISLAVASVTRAAPPVRQATRTRSWTGWRAAASIAVAALGATSVAVWHRGGPASQNAATQAAAPVAAVGAPAGGAVKAGATTAVASRGLSVSGGLSDLSDNDLESLLGEIGSLDATNVADPEDVVPAIGSVEGAQ